MGVLDGILKALLSVHLNIISQTILAVFVQLLTIGFPMIGGTLVTEQITSFAQVGILIVTSISITFAANRQEV